MIKLSRNKMMIKILKIKVILIFVYLKKTRNRVYQTLKSKVKSSSTILRKNIDTYRKCVVS